LVCDYGFPNCLPQDLLDAWGYWNGGLFDLLEFHHSLEAAGKRTGIGGVGIVSPFPAIDDGDERQANAKGWMACVFRILVLFHF
jgi:hypothetical protein